MNITDIRRINIEKAREKSNETNRLKGLRTFIKNKSKKSSIKNEIIDELIKSRYYECIYNIWLDSGDFEGDDIINKYLIGDYKDNDIDGLTIKDLDILCLVDLVPPEDLKDKYDGFFITELPVNMV